MSSHEQPLADYRIVELSLPRVWFVIGEAVLTLPTFKLASQFRAQCLKLFRR
jgi:hypothetical protein